jgi:beta-galactosidase
MKTQNLILILFAFFILSCSNSSDKINIRKTECFNKNWKFIQNDVPNASETNFNDSTWRVLNLPHDWSIEGEFSEKHPASAGGGALPGGVGWYRKTFTIPDTLKEKLIYIEFDGIYRNSEVWINGHYLGSRPYGYSSFRYELTPFLKYGNQKNLISVKVDNSKQPNSRWYSGSGIYRNVWLITTGKIAIEHWGTFVTTPSVNEKMANIVMSSKITNRSDKDQNIILITRIFNKNGKQVSMTKSESEVKKDSVIEIKHDLIVKKPKLWSVENPYLYKVISQIEIDGKVIDDYETPIGLRSFEFDTAKGFFLNGKPVKIKGVCDHHDLGCLGAAINTRALERQLEILKGMGCNGIRTSHNPPAPELLDLADRMGFIIMDEAFDMWRKKKTEFDYGNDFDMWHKRDLEDMVLRDRNHPSVFIWSIGNEILEQWDSTGIPLTRELVGIIKNLDTTRPVTSNCNDPSPTSFLIRSGALDMIGYSYHQQMFTDFPKTYPGQKFIGSETNSGLATRGHYDMPSDTIRMWPIRWDIPFRTGNPDFTCSSYDNCKAPWGSTHDETWRLIKKYDFLSGMFMWTGFDYLGEPTPYGWPARSSYFGVIDLAGFPKDAYYFYQSEWTNKPVLHIFPHWNWKKGKTIDIWAYTNCDEVELLLNGKSLGTQKKSTEQFHLKWPVVFEPGTLLAVGKKEGKEILRKEIKTAGDPAKIVLAPDRNEIKADGTDLSFVTIKILDKDGIIVPETENLITLTISGEGSLIGVDNGDPVSHLSLKGNKIKAFHGLCLAVIQAGEEPGEIKLIASTEKLEPVTLHIFTK